MKNVLRIFGSAALAAVIGFMMIACDEHGNTDSDDRPELTGTVTLDNTTPNVGDTIVASYSGGNGTGAAAWQWFVNNNVVSGTAGNSYTVAADDDGKTIKARVSFANQKGYKESAQTSAVTVSNLPPLTGTVTLDNTTPNVGDTITASYSDGNGTGAETWLWFAGDSVISGTEGNTYTVAEGDGGKTIKARVSFADQSGYKESEATSAVKQAVTGITLNKTALFLNIDQEETLIATVLPANARNKNVTWESDDLDTVTVSSEGKVTAKKEGTAIITATTEEGNFKASCNVTVVDPDYMIKKVSGGYEVTGKTFNAQTFTAIQTAVDAIRTDTAGADCTIQFGNGTDALDIGQYEYVNLSGAWGLVTLAGKITSANESSNQGTIVVSDSVSIDSKAEIANTVMNSGFARSINNRGTGTVTVSAGTVSGTSGVAIYNNSTGKIVITGGTVSSYTYFISSGIIYISSSGSSTDVRLEITGGTVTNTRNSSGYGTVYNESTGAVLISGGTITATHADSYAIQSTNANGQLVLSGSPDIERRIRVPHGKLSVTEFTPAAKTYALDFSPITAGSIAVTGGASFFSNFTLYNQPDFILAVSGSDIVVNRK